MLLGYDKDKMPMKMVKYLKKNFTEHSEYAPYFVRNNAKQVFKPLVIMVDWLNALIAYKTSPVDPVEIDDQEPPILQGEPDIQDV